MKDKSYRVMSAVTVISIFVSFVLWLDNFRLASLLDEAGFDYLTGMLTRKQLLRRLKRLERGGGRVLPIAILFIDVDGLKTINDKHGHRAGDLHLRKIAELIDLSIRPSDVSGRMGGDEFIVVLPNSGLNAASAVAERLRKACLNSAHRYPVLFSVGIAVKEDIITSIEEIIHLADQRMYEAKKARKTSV